MPAKLTTQAFIEKARAVHGELYDYSQVEYVSSKAKVLITCAKHGIFRQIPSHHIKGIGCAKCGFERSATARISGNKLFIQHAQAIHGDQYDYTLVKYSGNKKKIEVICHAHGSFFIRPNNHLSNKSGCPLCGKPKNSTQNFVDKCVKIFYNKYIYDKTLYNGSSNKLTITCPLHGDFEMVAAEHLRGLGCKKCGNELKSLLRKDNTYLQRIAAKFPELIIDNQKYQNSYSKLGATCSIHGHFVRIAHSMLKTGCPHCAMEARETGGRSATEWTALQKGREAVFYIVELSGNTGELFYKIGITFSMNSRFTCSKIPYAWRVLALYKSYDAKLIFSLEKAMLSQFKYLRYFPLLSFSGYTECISSVKEILHILPRDTIFI